LINQLDEGFQRKLTLISAPAGYGKSTLLSEWGHKSQAPIAWLSIDEGDNIRSRFWAYFRAALHTLPGIQETEIGDVLLRSLQSHSAPPVEEIFTSLINDLIQLPERVVLVLDGLQLITNSQIHTDLIFLLDHLPIDNKGLHIVVASRTNPPWPLARLRVGDDLMELRENDLRFSENEAAEFLNTMMGLDLSPKDVAVLEDKTEGWIAGLQMAAISLQKRLEAQGEPGVSKYIKGFTGGHQFVLDYLVEEVFNQQPLEIQDFLLHTSILERMTGELCDVVLDRDDSQSALSNLDKDNFFLIPLDETRTWYRYHHLFAELLRGMGIRSSQFFFQRGDGRIDDRIVHRPAQAFLGGDGLFELAFCFRWSHEIVPLIHPS
jgi:LuxR family maltose regulon positive regulatory protein